MVLGRAERDAEASCDVLVGRAAKDQFCHFAPSRRQPIKADGRPQRTGHDDRGPKRRGRPEVNRYAHAASGKPIQRSNRLPGSSAVGIAQALEGEAEFVDHILLEHINPRSSDDISTH